MKRSSFCFVDETQAGNMGFGVIGAGRCYLHQQQHGGSCSGWTNVGEHFILSCTSAKHQQRFRAGVFQIQQQR
jgi:isoaspartyl peptidase/L-asparaginase-like protein (Ntn-hydrolase superfamily)